MFLRCIFKEIINIFPGNAERITRKNGSGLGALFKTIWYVRYISTLKKYEDERVKI